MHTQLTLHLDDPGEVEAKTHEDRIWVELGRVELGRDRCVMSVHGEPADLIEMGERIASTVRALIAEQVLRDITPDDAGRAIALDRAYVAADAVGALDGEPVPIRDPLGHAPGYGPELPDGTPVDITEGVCDCDAAERDARDHIEDCGSRLPDVEPAGAVIAYRAAEDVERGDRIVWDGQVSTVRRRYRAGGRGIWLERTGGTIACDQADSIPVHRFADAPAQAADAPREQVPA